MRSGWRLLYSPCVDAGEPSSSSICAQSAKLTCYCPFPDIQQNWRSFAMIKFNGSEKGHMVDCWTTCRSPRDSKSNVTHQGNCWALDGSIEVCFQRQIHCCDAEGQTNVDDRKPKFTHPAQALARSGEPLEGAFGATPRYIATHKKRHIYL